MKLLRLNIFFLIIFSTFHFNFATISHATQPEDDSYLLVCSEWPPFEYSGKDGRPTGYSVEILEAILDDLNIKANIQIYPWARAYKTALNKKNTILFTMARTKNRENLFKWVGPIAERTIYLWKLKKRTDIKVNNIDDAKKYKIGTVRGEAGENQIIELGFEKYIPAADQAQNYFLLNINRIDLIYGLEFTTIYGLKKAGYDPDTVEKSILLSSDLKYYYGFNKNTSEEIVNQFREALQKIKDNGIFDEIVKKYNANK